MSENTPPRPFLTGKAPDIPKDRLKNMVAPPVQRSTTCGVEKPSESIVVRIPRSQTSVLLKLNTKLMVEQKETERENEAIRRDAR